MKKAIVLLVIVLMLSVVVSGCVTLGEEKEHGLLGTKKTTTSIGVGGIEQETKTCPFWNRDC